MIKTAKDWVAKLRAGNLSQTEVWVAVQSTIWQTLVYPLLALNLTRKECEAIMAPLLGFVLPALGIC
jgi:hypothetical protein